jgi:hypothetical protein
MAAHAGRRSATLLAVAALLAGCGDLVPKLRSQPIQGEVRIIRGDADGSAVLAADQGWLCVTGSANLINLPDLSRVDAEIERRALAGGWVNQGGVRLFAGPARDAAVAMGATVLAVGGRDDAWVLVSQIGWELRPIVTPMGRQLLTAGNSIRPCGAAAAR